MDLHETLEKLTLRGRVCFAVRCAMRLRPLYDRDRGEVIDRAIETGAEFCLGKSERSFDFGRAMDDADAAARDAETRADDTKGFSGGGLALRRAADAARAAARAADAAYAATRVAQGDAPEYDYDAHTTDAVVDAARTAIDFNDRDIELLLDMASGEGLGEPIDPSEQGPLGSLQHMSNGEVVKMYHLEGMTYQEISDRVGTPENSIGPTLSRARRKILEARATKDAHASLRLYVDPGNASKETIQEVLECLSDLHVAAGGLGLEFRPDGLSVLATEEAKP